MVLMIDEVRSLLVLIEVSGQVIEVFGHRHGGNPLEQAVDQWLFAQDQRNMIAEDLHRCLELAGQALLVDGQLAQAHQDIGGTFVAGDLGELQAAEQQVVSVGGHALQLQAAFVGHAVELGLDVVFGRRQKSQ